MVVVTIVPSEVGKVHVSFSSFCSYFYKALDKLEALISHNESDIETWLPLEYDLQLSYPVAFLLTAGRLAAGIFPIHFPSEQHSLLALVVAS